MLITLCFIFYFISLNNCQTIKYLNEISIEEELPIDTVVTYLTDKIPNLEQSIEYDLVTPLSDDFDVFSINHNQHALMIKNRIDYENLCLKKRHCVIAVSIAVSNDDTIDVYVLPIRIKNRNDNFINFYVNRTIIEIEENDEKWLEKRYSLPKAYDEDQDLITYSLFLQNWSKPDGLFELDEENLFLRPLRKFDREEQNIYLLRLIAHNQNDASTDIIVIIKDVNDNKPQCHQNQTLFIISNTSSISKFSLNVTDMDEGDNGKLDFSLVNSLPGFTIDRYNGEIKFDYNKWIRSNESMLIIHISDYGKPFRLSTKCFIEIKLTFLYDVYFQSNYSMNTNDDVININIKNVDQSFGYFAIYDQQNNRKCLDCLININSSVEDIFYFNYLTYDLHLNLNSIMLMRILTNYNIHQEKISLKIEADITNMKIPSLKSRKVFSFVIHMNKLNLLMHSNIYFLKVNENILLNEHISIWNQDHHCLNNQTNDLVLIDPTDTFDIDNKFNLILNKHLNVKRQNTYYLTVQQKQTNFTDETTFCSIQLRVYIVNPYSIANVYPYFPRPFYILPSKNLSQFFLPSIPSHVKYISSVPDLISIDSLNHSIIILSPLLYSYYYYDFYIQAHDSQVLSLTCSIPVRILFGINEHPPYLLINDTKQAIEVFSSNFLYHVQAHDPDISLNNQTNSFLPFIEYEIEKPTNVEIERFTGRIFLKEFNRTMINFTLIMKDFGQPDRLITKEILIFDIKTHENVSISFFYTTISILVTIILLSIAILIMNYCWVSHKKKLKLKKRTSWKNISPTTPDTRLIDSDYMTATVTSLPRVSSREQRIYPTLAYVNLHNDYQTQRRNLSHSSLDKINLQYSLERVSIRQDSQQHLSMTDINKYLERFEKLYHDSSSQQYLHQPIGSVV